VSSLLVFRRRNSLHMLISVIEHPKLATEGAREKIRTAHATDCLA
jgi:hypothetical protein